MPRLQPKPTTDQEKKREGKKERKKEKIKCQMKGNWHDMKEFAIASSLVMETLAKVTGSSSLQSLYHPAKSHVPFLVFTF